MPRKRYLLAAATALFAFAAAGCAVSQQSAQQEAASNMARSADSVSESGYAGQPAPPNGEAYDNMYFEHYGTNPFIATEEDRLSTFAADVDTGSYTVMRNYINRGELPPNDAVRVEEFVNYFPVAYPLPAQGDTFAIHTDGGPSPFGEGYDLLRIGIKGKEIAIENRLPAHLTFVIDVSGSMNRENRLELVKKSLRVLVDQLTEEDTVGIVVYGSRGRVLLEPTSIAEREEIMQAIDQLQPEGSTNAEEGLRLGYEMAAEWYEKGAINRVILCSDGVANVGKTGHEEILKEIEQHATAGIALSTFGFGMGNYNDVLMEQLADEGDGQYAYIGTFSEARRVFTEALTGTLQTIASEVKIQVEFDPGQVERYRLLGYENRDVRDEDFRNDKVDAGEIGSGHTVTALYEVKRKGSATAPLGTIRLRYREQESGQIKEIEQPLLTGNELSQDLRFLAAVAEYAEILRGSYWAKDGSLEEVLQLAEENSSGEQQMEFVRLVKDSIALQREE
ncbi:VWA domain-containing protein [Brevibacillus humidisoli]|uniref:vWA domain-containing protein n=1 Tax=Brevibacillus humidisoli TaxID=2895522 RepID=UPI001E4661A9|nr:VWA domain-containing protein [Brevibacillus humidisoli]UFJ39838.1 VWA domain-containing protein [Brevibacillus humidisoli]